MDNTYDSEYEVQKAILKKIGGDDTKNFDSPYEVQLEILEKVKEGGGGLAAPFYTTAISTTDQLGITEENDDNYANIALAIYKQNGLRPGLQLSQDDSNTSLDIDRLTFNIADTDTATAYRYDGIYYDSDATGELFIPITKLVNALDKTTADTYYNPINSVSASTSGFKFTKWNDKGQITGTTATAYQASQKVNGDSRSLYSTSSSALPEIYAPTTAGTNGQYLRSNGAGAPTWGDISIDPHIIDDASAITGDYTPAINAFYSECISKGYQANCYIKIVSYDVEGTVAESYYLPSSSRIYNGNVELWLFTTEDGNTWENIHYIITGETITRNVTSGTFGA